MCLECEVDSKSCYTANLKYETVSASSSTLPNKIPYKYFKIICLMKENDSKQIKQTEVHRKYKKILTDRRGNKKK